MTTYEGYGGGNRPPGTYLAETRADCERNVTGLAGADYHNAVSGCVLQAFNEFDKALFASRQYILTLWPAFIGAIVAIAPDPGPMIYDNVWWASLFAVTCGGLPGVGGEGGPPHHVEAPDEEEGRSMCEQWKSNILRPKKMSKRETMGASGSRGKGFLRLEWMCFLVSVALWMAFVVYFGRTLKPATNFGLAGGSYLKGAVWYYISCSPAVVQAIFEVIENRVEIYEPVNESDSQDQGPSERNTNITNMQTYPTITASDQAFRKVRTHTFFHRWLRIFGHQWRRTRYRLLVKQSSSHWFFLLGKALIGIGRITIFAWGSANMGNILLLPVPDDLWLFVLLLFTTAVPRQVWSAFWANGNRGADLVVFVKSVHLPGVV